MENKKQILSMQLNVDDFAPASDSEKESLSVMRESVSFWKDGLRRLRKNPIAMVSLAVLIIVLILAFIVPAFYPYDYATQIRGSENLGPMQYSEAEQAAMAAGEKVFPHILGTDSLGRDYAVRVMMGTRVSLSVGLLASVLVLLIGSVYGSVAGFLGGKVDLFMMRIVDIIYTVPDLLIIILLASTLKYPLQSLAEKPGFGWINIIGVPLISILIVFALLYWVGMARIVRSQVLTLKESEYVRRPRSWRRHGPHHQKAHSDELHRHAQRHHHTADPFGHLYRELSFVPGHRRFRAHAIAGQPGQHGHRRSAELSVPPVRAGHRHLRRHPQLQPVRRRPARCIRPEAEKLNERKGRTHE